MSMSRSPVAAPAHRRRPRGRCSPCSLRGAVTTPRARAAVRSCWSVSGTAPGTSPSTPAPGSPAISTSITTSTGTFFRPCRWPVASPSRPYNPPSSASSSPTDNPKRHKETAMAVPLRQAIRVGSYVARQRLRRNEKFALVLQLEPLYQCNLACAGCGKIQHEDAILQRRLTVQQCIDAVEECEAPMVALAGGEPVGHGEIDPTVN